MVIQLFSVKFFTFNKMCQDQFLPKFHANLHDMEITIPSFFKIQSDPLTAPDIVAGAGQSPLNSDPHPPHLCDC